MEHILSRKEIFSRKEQKKLNRRSIRWAVAIPTALRSTQKHLSCIGARLVPMQVRIVSTAREDMMSLIRRRSRAITDGHTLLAITRLIPSGILPPTLLALCLMLKLRLIIHQIIQDLTICHQQHQR